jgi:hypothetical protein
MEGVEELLLPLDCDWPLMASSISCRLGFAGAVCANAVVEASRAMEVKTAVFFIKQPNNKGVILRSS